MSKEEFSYPIDYDLYTTDEIIDLVDFLHLVEKYHEDKHAVNHDQLKRKYKDFQFIINNKGEQKRIDQAFSKHTGFSIYKTMKELD